MRPKGRHRVALAGWTGLAALGLCLAIAGRADTIKTEVDLSTKEIGSKEAVLGDFVADALKASAKTDAAFIAATSFNDSATIPKGGFNASELVNALAYKNDTIVIVKLTGDQITRALEQGLFLYPKSNSAFLQLAGLVVTVKPDADAGKRDGTIKIGGDTLDAKKTYKVAMPAPLAKGGLAYFKIWQKANIDKDTDVTVETAVNTYLEDHKTIAKGDERLVIKGK